MKFPNALAIIIGFVLFAGILTYVIPQGAFDRTTDPDTGKEMPIQVVKYVYDVDGNRSAPIVYNLLPGKTFEEVFGVKSSALETNPFKDGGQ